MLILGETAHISFNSQKIPLLIVPGVTRSWLLATKLEHNINNAWAPSKIHALTVPGDGRMPVLRKYLHEKIFHKNICKIWKCNCWRCHSKCSHAAGLIRGKFVLAAGSQMYDHSSASKSSIRRFVITEKAPTRAFSWLKAATTAFTFKTLLCIKTLC